MMRKRLLWIVMGAGGLAMLGGLLAVFLILGDQQQPRPAAQALAPAEQEEAAPAASPAWVPLAAMATIDEVVAEAPTDRDARIQFVEGLFTGQGLQIRPDGSTRYEKRDQPALSVTTSIAEIAVYQGREKVRALQLNAAPQREVVNDKRTGSITFQDVTPGIDLQFVYDGKSLKEAFTLQKKLVDELAASDAEELRITYRFDEMRRPKHDQPLEFRQPGTDEPLSSSNLGPEQSLFLSRPGLTDFEFPPAFVEGGTAGKLFLARRLDLTDQARPQLSVSLPLSYLQGAKGAVTIDPTLLDRYASMNTNTMGEPLARGRDGTLYLAYRRFGYDPGTTQNRWAIHWASGKGLTWTKHGHISPVRVAPVGYGADMDHPTMAITGDGTLHAAWYEYYRGDWTGEGVNRFQVVHAYKKPADDKWIATGFVWKDLGGEQYHPTLAVDKYDNVYLLFYLASLGRYWLGQFDPNGASEVPTPPPPVGSGLPVVVSGSWKHITTFHNGSACSELNLQASEDKADGKVMLHANFTRCSPGIADWIGKASNDQAAPSDKTWTWNPTRYVNNDPAFGSLWGMTLFGPNKAQGVDAAQVYTYGDPKDELVDPNTGRQYRDPYIWRYLDYSQSPPAEWPNREVCGRNLVYELGDMAVADNLMNPDGTARADSDPVGQNDVFWVTRLRAYNYLDRAPNVCWKGWGFNSYQYRTYFARYDASLGRWVDQTLVFGPNEQDYNRYIEQWPKVVVATDGSAHVLAYQEGVPWTILYRKRKADGVWEDWKQLVPGGLTTYAPQVRGKNYPQATGDASNGDKCRYTCTAKCQEEKKCGNRVDADTLDVVYTVDGNKIIYVSTGQPQEVSKPRRPLNHTYTTQTNPSFSWDRISTDQPGVADDVCYKLEIATTPLFRTGAVNDIVYEKPTGAPQWNPASYICTDQHVPDATGTWAAAYNGDKKLKNGEYYYWRVYPVNSAGMGFPSDVFEFGVDNQKPAAFDLLEPGSVAAPFPDPGTKTPTFKWQASCDAPLVRDPADASKCIRP